jgi:hypothetical protein
MNPSLAVRPVCARLRVSRSTVALACSLLGAIPLSAAAQDCGPNPELNVKWSESFQKATLHDACSSSDTQVQGLGEDFYFSGGQKTSACSKDTLNENQSADYVQTEIASQGPAIVAACGYYACKLSNSANSLANISVIADVCSTALHSSKGIPFRDFKIEPSFMPLVILKPTTMVKVFLTNETNGILTFDKPNSTDGDIFAVAPAGPSFSIDPHHGKWVTLKVDRPAVGDSPKQAEISFNLKNNVDSKASIHFALARSRDDFESPPSIGCGRLNPHMIATAYSDRARGQGFDPKTSENNGFAPVPTGQTLGFEHAGSEYTWNGHGSISISMDSSCTTLEPTQTHATSILAFSTTTTAVSGHCCSGFGPGGDGAANPEWIDQISLPGDAAHDMWRVQIVTLTSKQGQNPQCSLGVDGTQAPINVGGQITSNLRLKPGSHQIAFSCSAGRVGSRPGGWDNTATFNEKFNITVDANRVSK